MSYLPFDLNTVVPLDESNLNSQLSPLVPSRHSQV